MSNSPSVGHILSMIISVISLVATIATQCGKSNRSGYTPLNTAAFKQYEDFNEGNVRVSDSLRMFVIVSTDPYKNLLPPKNKPKLQALLKRKNLRAYTFEKQDDSTAIEKAKIDSSYTIEIKHTVFKNYINYEIEMIAEQEILNIDKLTDWYNLLYQFIFEIDNHKSKQTSISFANAGEAILQTRRFSISSNKKQLPINFDDGEITIRKFSTQGGHSSIGFVLAVPIN
jgi:hypothetical protein